MTRETRWRKEWEVLRAEREAARRGWRSAADGLAARARDPLGLGGLIRDHPLAATGIGAAAGALLVNLLLRGGSPRTEEPSRQDSPPRPGPSWQAALRDAAIGLVVPWLVRKVEEEFGGAPEEPGESAPEASAPGRAPDVRPAGAGGVPGA